MDEPRIVVTKDGALVELRAAALARRSLVSEALRAPAAEAIAANAEPVLAELRPKVVAGSMPFRLKTCRSSVR